MAFRPSSPIAISTGMGWLSSLFGFGGSGDALGKLDPQVREFLEKESPVKYTPNHSVADSPSRNTDSEAEKPRVPSASLYPDGRYAQLWKTYQPLAQIEAEAATDHDKLMSVLEGFKGRKAALGKAALENCALQQEEWANCMTKGAWEDKLQMCRHQARRFEKCYTMQSRLLRALGYGSVMGRSAQVEEEIQMRADALFHRIVQHQEAVAKAREDGTPMPVFEPVIAKAAAGKSKLTNEVEKSWREKLEKLPEDERAIEEAALRADHQVKADVARNIGNLRQMQQEERKARVAEGKATLMDKVLALFGRDDK